MEYIELPDEWLDELSSDELSGSGYDFVVLTLNDGTRHSATLLNEKRIKVNNEMSLDDVEDIEVR